MTLKELGINVQGPESKAFGMCTLYDNVDARITKDMVIFGPIGKDGEYKLQLKIETKVLRAIVNYIDEVL